MQKDSTSKQLTFLSIYVAQSVPMSLISTLLPVLMRQGQFSLTTIGLLQFIKLPWILKLLWAPLVDKHTNDLRSYKRWIWGSEIAYALCMLVLSALNLQVNFGVILSLVVLAFVCSATQDIATDALTSRAFRGDTISANRLQSMGQFAGTIVGGGLLTMAYRYLGWSSLFYLLALLVIVLLIPLHFYKQEPQTAISDKGQQDKSVGWGDIISFFKQKGAGSRCTLLLLYNSGLVGVMAMMKPYLVDAGYALGDIAWLFSLYGAGCGFCASYLAGRYLRHIARGKALVIGASIIISSVMCIMLMAHFAWISLFAVMLSLLLLWGSYGVGTVVVYATAMDSVREGREGTDFTLQIVMLHLSSLVIAGISGKLAQLLGYPLFFALELGLALISLAYILMYNNEQGISR